MIVIRKWQGSPAAREQASQILGLLTQVYGSSPWTVDQLEADLLNPLNSYILACQDGQVIGLLALQENDFEAEVLQIAVRPDQQGRGLATALFADLPVDKEIFLEVRQSNGPACAFYHKAGFEEIARRKNYYHTPVEDAIIMKRERNEG